MTGETKNRTHYLREEYISRMNRVVDHIEQHLDESLTLDGLARVANFSKFHFHRVFRAMMGETLNQFIRRLRVERAAVQLVGNPKKSITEIAIDCGFSSPATFARAFRELFGVSASAWREQGHPKRKNGQTNRKNGQTDHKDSEVFSHQICHVEVVGQTLSTWRIEMSRKNESPLKATVEIVDMPDRNVVYVRHIGSYAGQTEVFRETFGKLFAWAGPRGLIDESSEVLSVYHDDMDITEEDKLRMDACLTVPEGTPVEGDMGTMIVPGGRFAVARFEVREDEFGDAWDSVVQGWLPESGFQPDDRLCFEICRSHPDDHPENKQLVDICVPVRPL